MQLVISNTTGSTITYLSGAVSVAGGGSTAVTSPVQQLALANDGALRSDILLNNVYITDGTNQFGTSDALEYLQHVVQALGPNSDGIGNILTSTTINSKQRLDVNAATEAVDGATAPFNTTQSGGKDSAGNLQAHKSAVSGEQFVKDVLDVSGQNRAQSVTTSAAEALGGATILANRKVLSIRPTNGIIYWGFVNTVTTTTGTPIYTNEVFTIAVTDNVHIYLIAAQTTDVRIAEGS